METKTKEERSEYVGIYVTPTVAKEIKLAKDNTALQDDIIKRFVSCETEFIKNEIQGIDEIVVQYRAKLLTIRDKFSEVQNIYVEEIENLFQPTQDALSRISNKYKQVENEIQQVKIQSRDITNSIDEISKKLHYVNFSSLEKLIELAERFGKLTEQERELVKMLVKTDA